MPGSGLEVFDRLDSHPLYKAQYEFNADWEFEIHDDRGLWPEIMHWIMDNATDEFFMQFCDYYYIVGFRSETDAMFYKLVWEDAQSSDTD